MLGAASEGGQVVVDCLRKLGKLAQPGEVSPAGQQNQLQQMLMKAIQNGQMQKKLQASQQGGGAPGGGQPQAQAA